MVTRGEPDRFSIEAGGKTFDVSLGDTGCDEVGYGIDGAHARAVFARSGADLHLRVEGQPYRFADLTRAPAKVERDAGGDGRLRASMSGRVVTVHAKAGDTVERGQPLITLEAMKMQHVHPAPSSGRVTGVHVAAGDQVGTGRVMVEIAAA